MIYRTTTKSWLAFFFAELCIYCGQTWVVGETGNPNERSLLNVLYGRKAVASKYWPADLSSYLPMAGSIAMI